MRKELDEALCRDFPMLFRHRNDRHSCMQYGMTCGDGWEPIIRRMATKLEALIERQPHDERASAGQVKEKFGLLRVYIDNATDEMFSIRDAAESESRVTCEDCGVPGHRRPGGWIRTLCEGCWESWSTRK